MPCLSPSLGDRPLRPPTDRRLGEPLPHQRANRTQAPPEAPFGFGRTNERATTCGISHPFGQLFPTSGQVTYALLSRPPLASEQARRLVRLTCLMHAASVYPEPGSNSPKRTDLAAGIDLGVRHPLMLTGFPATLHLLRCSVRAVGGSGAQPPHIEGSARECQPRCSLVTGEPVSCCRAATAPADRCPHR